MVGKSVRAIEWKFQTSRLSSLIPKTTSDSLHVENACMHPHSNNRMHRVSAHIAFSFLLKWNKWGWSGGLGSIVLHYPQTEWSFLSE